MWGISLPQILIILLIVLLIFGTKRLRTLGGDLGSALRGFRKAMDDDEEPSPPAQLTDKDKERDPAAGPEAAGSEAARETEKVDRAG